jgi:hypothetical protein
MASDKVGVGRKDLPLECEGLESILGEAIWQ